MGIYRRIEVHTWVDEKFRKLTPIQPSGQGLWFYLLTGPQTGIIPGLFKAGHASMAEDLGWEAKAFEEAFREVLREGLAKDSVKDRLVWIPNAIKYNPPTSPNVIRSWSAALDTLPECKLMKEAIEYMRKEIYLLDKKEVKGFTKAFDEVFGKAFAKAFGEALPKAFGEALPKGNANPLPNQEQEQDTGTETKEEGEEPSPTPAPAPLLIVETEEEKPDGSPPGVYGDHKNIPLTQEQYFGLVERFGMDAVDVEIENMSSHLNENPGKKYRDYVDKLTEWLRKDGHKEKTGPWSTASPVVPEEERTPPGEAKHRIGSRLPANLKRAIEQRSVVGVSG